MALGGSNGGGNMIAHKGSSRNHEISKLSPARRSSSATGGNGRQSKTPSRGSSPLPLDASDYGTDESGRPDSADSPNLQSFTTKSLKTDATHGQQNEEQLYTQRILEVHFAR